MVASGHWTKARVVSLCCRAFPHFVSPVSVDLVKYRTAVGGCSEVDPGLQLTSSVQDGVSGQTCAKDLANSVLVAEGEWGSSQTLGEQSGGVN